MVLDAIYRGNLSIELLKFPNNPEYKQNQEKVSSMIDALKQNLSEEDRKRLDQLLDQYLISLSIESEACFRAGFSAGLELQREVAKELRDMEISESS